MEYTNSKLATVSVDLTKNSNPRKNDTYNPTGKITKVTIHHMAGIMGAKACAEMHARGTNSSANYYIGKDGEICVGVPESRRAWTSSSSKNDYNAVTIEVSNDIKKAPWSVSKAAYESLIKLCVDICKRNDIKALNYTGDTKGNLTMHKWFSKTACPGPYLEGKFPEIADKVNVELSTEKVKETYFVQVGVFSKKENAQKLKTELKSKGYDAVIVKK